MVYHGEEGAFHGGDVRNAGMDVTRATLLTLCVAIFGKSAGFLL